MDITGVRIKELRKERSMRQQELADILQNTYGFVTPYTTISRWEHGKQMPEVQKMKAMAEIFGVTLDYIAGLTDKRDGKVKQSIRAIIDDPSYNPFYDETNEFFTGDKEWRLVHGAIDERAKLYAIVNKCRLKTDSALDRILAMIDLIGD